jgi:hypothetical protein
MTTVYMTARIDRAKPHDITMCWLEDDGFIGALATAIAGSESSYAYTTVSHGWYYSRTRPAKPKDSARVARVVAMWQARDATPIDVRVVRRLRPLSAALSPVAR